MEDIAAIIVGALSRRFFWTPRLLLKPHQF